jgi:3-hydroxyisobutyrate dehydrogenase-like beta-hydroxyacid dehydrogenase
MTRVAMLGLGAMGARMAANLVAAGHEVAVWNRTPRTVEGAVAAPSPRAAAEGAEVVMSMVRDDAASARVWLDPEDGALAGLAPGAVGVECSTVSPDHARALHARAAERGVAFLDAPLAGSRPQAEARALIFMAGGDEAHVARAEPVLLAMGAAVHRAGGPGAGAVAKVMVNAMLAVQLATLGELIGLARGQGVDPARALDILGVTPVASPAAKGAGAAMLTGQFSPAFPIALVAKDLALAQAAARHLPVTTATARVYAAALAAGRGEENITAVVKAYT